MSSSASSARSSAHAATGSHNVYSAYADLGELLDNGGPVLTFSPLDGSLAIDAAGELEAPDLFDADQDGIVEEVMPRDARGGLRIVGAGGMDIGAVEHIVNERIGGTDGANSIVGGLGKDTLKGGEGDDTLRGGDQNDILRGDGGMDLLDGGKGNDIADYSYETDALTIVLKSGTFTIIGSAVPTKSIEGVYGGGSND